jgi:uncharacterized membrane protein YkoI
MKRILFIFLIAFIFGNCISAANAINVESLIKGKTLQYSGTIEIQKTNLINECMQSSIPIPTKDLMGISALRSNPINLHSINNLNNIDQSSVNPPFSTSHLNILYENTSDSTYAHYSVLKESIKIEDPLNQADIFNSSKYPETLYNPISKTITIRGSYGQATIISDDSAMDVILTLQEAQEIAEQYAKDHSSLFATTDMYLRDAELLDHGDGGKEYQFIWVQKIGKVMTPNKVVVSINPETGGVIGFAEINKDISVTDLTPNISADEAKEKALKQFNPMVLTSPIETTLKIDFVGHDVLRNNQKLLWEVRIMGDPINSTDCGRGGIVQIDAKTGEVLNIDPWM